MDTRSLVIVGGGFAGAALAYHLLQQRSSQLQLTLVESGACIGRGVAYAARSPALRLNVPASRMSIDPAQPDDFVRFACAHADPHAFLPRRLYGAYVSQRLARAREANPGALRILRGSAVNVNGCVQLADGRVLAADHVLLATGVSARHGHGLPQDARIVDAWDEAALARLPRDSRVLLLGSGLSALDVLSVLHSSGHCGESFVLSRHGLLPRAHAARPGSYEIPAKLGPPPTTLRELLRWSRALLREAHLAGVPWQYALDALRPVTQRLWQAFSPRDRARFVRLVRPYWEVLRHRAPSDVLQRVAARQARGELRLAAGRVLECHADPAGLHVSLRMHGGERRSERFDAIVRCLGPSLESADAAPLMASLLRAGQAQACRTRLGIVTGSHGELIDARGRASRRVFAIGQLCRASRWETTAAPDIVRDAVALAELLG